MTVYVPLAPLRDRLQLVPILAGERLSGGAPTRTGWIELDDDESWILDDGTIALVGRPSPTRPSGFAKKVSLPSDAMLRRATSEPLGNGGLLVTVPRVPLTTYLRRAEREYTARV